MDNTERRALTMSAISLVLSGDVDQAAVTLDRIIATSCPAQMYTVCCAFATVGAHALRTKFADRGPNNFLYIKPPGPGTADSPARMFARRFITTFANRDHAMTKALFAVAHEAPGDQFQRSVAALLNEAAHMHMDVCEDHHKAVMGLPEPQPGPGWPARAWTTPSPINDSRVHDQRAIASGKRRSRPHTYRAAQAATSPRREDPSPHDQPDQ
ncbi:hypothetical protein [Streptomyces cavernae]|uniref:hypothetical protein n=1 Tax=Streptomyces cavernae TaxID=2259034 RepID=UPI000FEC1EF3|nr:hypothetical protein [Streptomyces cavernae]